MVCGVLALLTRRPYVALLLALVCVAAPALTWVAGLVQPIYMLRTVIWPVFSTHLLMSAGVLALRRRSVAATLTVTIVVLQVADTWAYYQSSEKENWRLVASIMAGRIEQRHPTLSPLHVSGSCLLLGSSRDRRDDVFSRIRPST